MAGSALPLILLGGAALLLMGRSGGDGGDDGDDGVYESHGPGHYVVVELEAMTEADQAKGDWAWTAWISEPHETVGGRAKTQAEGATAAKQWLMTKQT